jgi:uncharacterized protein
MTGPQVEDEKPNPTALITGASSGIGLAFAKLFARDGYDIVLVSQHQADLERVAELLRNTYGAHKLHLLPKDLSRAEAAPELYEEVKQRAIAVDILVNNAGFGIYGKYAASDYHEQLKEIEVNVTALSILTSHFAASMVERKSGKILNVASCAAFQPGPYMAVYYASKAYVVSFSMALYEELKKDDVHVTVLCPGPTKTAFAERAKLKNAELFQKHAMDADTVARMGYRGLMRNRPLVITGASNKLLAFGAKLSPLWLSTKVSGMLNS